MEGRTLLSGVVWNPIPQTITVTDISSSNTITVNVGTVTGTVRVTEGSSYVQESAGSVKSILITESIANANDTVDVENNLNIPVTVNDGSGTDAANISPSAKNLNNIGGSVTVNGGWGTDTLNVYDQADPNNGSIYTMTGSSVSRTGSTANISYDWMNVVSIYGSSQPATYSVLGTENGFTTNLIAGGPTFPGSAATVNVGNNGSVAGILGTLNISNPPNWNAINIDDSLDTSSRTVTLSTLTTSPGSSSSPWGQVQFGGLSAPINYAYSDTSGVIVQGGKAGNTWNVLATGVTTQIVDGGRAGNPQGGFGHVNVGNNVDGVQDIDGLLEIENPTSFNYITVNNSADPTSHPAITISDPTITVFGNRKVTCGEIAGLAPALIQYVDDDTTSVTVQSGTGGDTFNVQHVAVPTTLIGGAGGTTFYLFDQSGNNLLTLDGGGAGLNNQLNYSNYSVSSNPVANGVVVNLANHQATGTVAISDIENVFGGSGNDSITGDGQTDVLNGGLGDNVLYAGAGNNTTLYGVMGNDTLTPGSGNDIMQITVNFNDMLQNRSHQIVNTLPYLTPGATGTDTFNVQMDMGSFGSNVLQPFLSNVAHATSAFQPIINFLNSDVPLINETYAQLIGGSNFASFVNAISTINSLSNSIGTPGGMINLGTYTFTSTSTGNGNLTGTVTTITNPSWSGMTGGTSLQSAVNSGIGFNMPLFQNPTSTVWFLFGQNVDLISFDPKLSLSANPSVTISVPVVYGLGSVDLTLGGELGFSARAHIAYDTTGFQTGNLLDGLYVSQAYASISVGLTGSIGVSTAFGEIGADVGGYITATATCNLDNGGVVRLDTLGNVGLTFPVSGQLQYGVTVGAWFFGQTDNYTLWSGSSTFWL